MIEFLKNKSVALVGPAKYMSGSNYGVEIDSHDVVVRINRGIESIKSYGDDIGKRTDIYYSCLIETSQQTGKLDVVELKDDYKIKYIVAPPESDFIGMSSKTDFHSLVDKSKMESFKKHIPIRIIEHDFFLESLMMMWRDFTSIVFMILRVEGTKDYFFVFPVLNFIM